MSKKNKCQNVYSDVKMPFFLFCTNNETVTLSHQFHQHVNEQLLCSQIPKAQKDRQVKQLFVLSGSARVKAERKNNDEIDPCYLSHFCALLSPKEHEY